MGQLKEQSIIADGLLDRLRQAYNGLSIPKIAQRIDVFKQTLYKWGRRESIPETKTLLTVHSQTGCSLNWLLFNEGPMRASPQHSQGIDLRTIEGKLMADANVMIERKLFSTAAIILGGLLELHILSLMEADQRDTVVHLDEAATLLRESGLIKDKDESVIRFCSVVKQKALQKDTELTSESVQLMRDFVIQITQQSSKRQIKVK